MAKKTDDGRDHWWQDNGWTWEKDDPLWKEVEKVDAALNREYEKEKQKGASKGEQKPAKASKGAAQARGWQGGPRQQLDDGRGEPGQHPWQKRFCQAAEACQQRDQQSQRGPRFGRGKV